MARERVGKVFTYIRELTKLRTPPVGEIKSYEWNLWFSSLPTYPTIQTSVITDDKADDFDGVILRIKRPPETSCPAPPWVLEGWIENGWENISKEAAHISSRNKTTEAGTITEQFDSNPERPKAFKDWQRIRSEWQAAEKPARDALKVFQDFFKLHGQMQREFEKFQLYLGDGILNWQSAIEKIEHPMVLKKVELEFDSVVPEFIIRDTDDSPELYTTLLRHHELEGLAILACKTLLEDNEPHPLAESKTTEFFKFFIQRFFPNGRLCDSKNEVHPTDPSIYRDPVLFLGSRAQGFSEALDKLIDQMPKINFLPEALFRLVGIDQKVSPDAEGGHEASIPEISKTKEIDFLLTKPANKEQERVITRLEETGSVLVQGPPGTGKSHTIANIIGHLLASGKTVLVSSHTSKALKVVRDKVVKPLQPLCVSVLENDAESKAQLEESVNGIISYLSRNDEKSLEIEIRQLSERRQQIKSQLKVSEEKAIEIRKGEYLDIIVAGEPIPPSEAARKVSDLDANHGWVSGPLTYGAPLPLAEEEFIELYKSNEILSVSDVVCIEEGIPDLETALKPFEFKELVSKIKSVDRSKADLFSDYWNHGKQNPEAVESLQTNLNKTLEIISTQKWIRKIVEDSRLGEEYIKPWHSLMELVESTSNKIAIRSEQIFKHGPALKTELSHEAVGTAEEILVHLKSGKNLSFFSTVFKPSWKDFIANCTVENREPSRLEHFEAIFALLETLQMRKDLVNRWERQVVSIGGPNLGEVSPEVQAKTFSTTLKIASSWTSSVWNSIEVELKDQGFNLKIALEKISLAGKQNGHIEEIKILTEATLLPALDSRLVWLQLKNLNEHKEKLLRTLMLNAQKSANKAAYLSELLEAVETLNTEKYEIAYNKYLDVRSKVDVCTKRKQVLDRLKSTAPGWAKAIEMRSSIHGAGVPPDELALSWRVSQWKQELNRRIAQDYAAVQRDIHRLKNELTDVNAQYVEKLAWSYQQKRTGLKEKQALSGWQLLQKKITKSGKGKRDVHIKREARNTLKDCKNAVPVWIMPLSRVFDSFDLVQTKFDVIILDEASQSDITSLVAFVIAKQVIVVGDNAQVTPHAVGQELGKIQMLIDELLQGIPNRMAYDGKTSVYDLAEQSFGETIRLVEHFRCVPDIIQFSNQLSYSGEIRPLREASSSSHSQALVAHRVAGKLSGVKINNIEAMEVASIVAAMSEMPEYARSSIGVISMVGQEQAIVIDTILQRRLDTSIYSKHSLLCGNASQFQGDERDVILISMVDSCEEPPLSIRQTEDFKKTFNVAVSRARDQLWVVHSLNPSTDLKPGDLRLRLIKHAESPNSLANAIEETQKKADPNSVVFEQMVIKDLMNAGFRVVPQWQVGAYKIDMVVLGAGKKRIAIECDGDRFHPPEKLVDDIQRQMVLERLKWKFIRIRGSEYFRNREATVKRIIAELEQADIERLGPFNDSSTLDSDVVANEVRTRLLQRAFEIKQVWESTPEEEPVEKTPKARWGKKVADVKK